MEFQATACVPEPVAGRSGLDVDGVGQIPEQQDPASPGPALCDPGTPKIAARDKDGKAVEAAIRIGVIGFPRRGIMNWD
ncbi:hypothetical protein FQR65_LT20282 [Abscondita terminalis]|nr:hypothetical protein FQR65_LT20282 [Abscondita terminalis]